MTLTRRMMNTSASWFGEWKDVVHGVTFIELRMLQNYWSSSQLIQTSTQNNAPVKFIMRHTAIRDTALAM